MSEDLPVKFGSVCSGIEAASVAWHPLGWRAAWLAEIEAFPSAVLAHHYPGVPNLGDMTRIAGDIYCGAVEAPDVLVGGTPCQAFSVAGMRKGLDDARGQLTIKYVELANAIDDVRIEEGQPPAIIVWENVPGVLSSKDNAFGCFLGALAGEVCELQPPGGKWRDAGCVYGPQRTIAWRVLDAQYFGVAQRRRRVFVVASARTGFDPASVLFELEGVRRDTAPSRSAGKTITHPIAPGVDLRNGTITGEVTQTLQAGHHAPDPGGTPHVLAFNSNAQVDQMRFDPELSAPLTCSQNSAVFALQDTTGREKAQNGKGWNDEGPSYTVDTVATQGVAICVTEEITHTLKAEGFDASEGGTGRGQPITAVLRGISDYGKGLPCLRAKGGDASGGSEALVVSSAVRRLTPRECERLQGFPDGYTQVPYRNKEAADGPRYKALGNSMAVPCMAWIGQRIVAELEAEDVDDLI